MSKEEINCTFAIVGGGIAGVSCVESIGFLAPEESTVLITASPLIKAVTNIIPLGKTLMQFNVEEKDIETLTNTRNSLIVIHDFVEKVNTTNKQLETKNGRIIHYKMLCLCNGARPKLVAECNNFVLGIRDTESVVQFSQKIKSSRKIVIIGNGGIATEIIHEVDGIEMVWVIKDKHISATFIDPGAAEFFVDKVYRTNTSTNVNTNTVTKRMRYTISDPTAVKAGPALGPDWHNNFDIKGLEDITKGEDGGLLVDWKLETSKQDVYAAGDVCSAGWEIAKHWFQMRLWTQAHQMGRYAAKSMVSKLRNEEFLQDFCFELFTHVTKFFGYKVVLLGLFNGQKLDNKYEILLRMTKGQEYIKLILENGKMQGAVLIGDTDLEEMCENLILNQLDLSDYGEDLLNPDIDIEDYFD
nr:PREDICTED: pyridine nucleotide-disulfide oxidoreductase domain-containing protein 1 isoform X3 [Megachile rotundata]